MPPGTYIRTPEICNKIGKSLMGRTPWNKGLTGYKSGESHYRWGKHLSDDIKTKISETCKAKGIKPSVIYFARGEKSPSWRGGVAVLHRGIRASYEYQEWRKKVFARDDYRCFDCGERGGLLHAHHIYPFSKFPRLRLMLENGITLCGLCHRKTGTFGNNVLQDNIKKSSSKPFIAPSTVPIKGKYKI